MAQPSASMVHFTGESGQRSLLADTPSVSMSAQPTSFTSRPTGVPSHTSMASLTPSWSPSRCSAAQPTSSMSVEFAGVCGHRSSESPVTFTSLTPSLSSSSSSDASAHPSSSKSVCGLRVHDVNPLGQRSSPSKAPSLSSSSSSSRSKQPSPSQSVYKVEPQPTLP